MNWGVSLPYSLGVWDGEGGGGYRATVGHIYFTFFSFLKIDVSTLHYGVGVGLQGIVHDQDLCAD